MKRILEMLAVALAAAIITIVAGTGLNSCENNPLGSCIKGPGVDSAQVVDIVNDVLNPEFYDVDEVLIYKDFALAKQERRPEKPLPDNKK